MRNLTLMTDLYQLTMMNAYYKSGISENIAVFDLFFRENEHLSYAVSAGLEQAADYIKELKFSDTDIDYIKSLNIFDSGFIKYLSGLKFTGDIYSVPEGTLVFPGEPIMIVKAPLVQAQFVETALLNIVNHQTLIATKASRIATAAGADKVVEFGLRRAQGPDAAIYGARSATIGGAHATSNLYAGKMFGLDVAGTHAHSFVMSYGDELTAFREFAKIYPDNCILLVDTFDTLKSGIPNAIKVFDELKAKGHKPGGIRLDSGDLAYLSKKARAMLDNAGHNDITIFASGDLDENVIASLKSQNAKIDAWGVGTRMITSGDMPSLGGVYKLAAFENNGVLSPRMKMSDSLIKMTNPCFKKLYRIYDKQGKAYADLIAVFDEKIPSQPEPLTLTHPVERWKTSVLTEYTVRELLVPIFKGGKLVYNLPDMDAIKSYAAGEKESFWEEYKRNERPQLYKVDLSDKLYNIKQELLKK